MDDQIVCDTHKAAFDLVKGLKRTLQAEVKPMITQCCIQAIYETNDQEAIELAKSFERRRCNHPPKEAKPPLECLQSVVNVNGVNKHRYVVATQNQEIRGCLRKVPGVPLVFMNRSVMVMEPLSKASQNVSRVQEREKLFKGLNDPKFAGLPLTEQPATATAATVDKEGAGAPAKKRKGPKGPNPLSIKKKKTSESRKEPVNPAENTSATLTENDNKEQPSRRRKRSHKKTTPQTAEETTSEQQDT